MGNKVGSNISKKSKGNKISYKSKTKKSFKDRDANSELPVKDEEIKKNIDIISDNNGNNTNIPPSIDYKFNRQIGRKSMSCNNLVGSDLKKEELANVTQKRYIQFTMQKTEYKDNSHSKSLRPVVTKNYRDDICKRENNNASSNCVKLRYVSGRTGQKKRTNNDNDNRFHSTLNLTKDESVNISQNRLIQFAKESAEYSNKSQFDSLLSVSLKRIDGDYKNKLRSNNFSSNNFVLKNTIVPTGHQKRTDNDNNDKNPFRYTSGVCKLTDTSSMEKRGLNIHQSYRILIAIIQVLRSCKTFKEAIIMYHLRNSIVYSTEDDQKKIFVNSLCKIMVNLEEKKPILIQMNEMQKYAESYNWNNIFKCFVNILTIVNDVSKERKEKSLPNVCRKSIYEDFKYNYRGFVFDCFYGEMCYSIFCESCGTSISRNYQLFKYLLVPVPVSTFPQHSVERMNLKNCLNKLFESSEIKGDHMMICKCEIGNERIILKSEITQSPEYLFIYLARGSHYTGGPKSNTFITCNKELSVSTASGEVSYKLISAIEYLERQKLGQYFCRCSYESDEWWFLHDTQVSLIPDARMEDIISNLTIVFMFKKTNK